MKKSQYNQGDLLQFQRTYTDVRHLLVITDVFTSGLGHDSLFYYKLKWLDDGSKQVYKIKTIDDDPNFKLLARGQ